ncbi:hypothetical protein V6N13_149313 [Hibiscus sabdariffa]|uniref:S-acyltransferase n=1 Tax=Hibiscus sabdariffa TaxID=183260 RepID=A0ABR2EHP6_9ROSI
MYRAQFPAQLSGFDRRVTSHNPTSVRVYQVWKGSNKFFLGGRVIFGPDVRSIFLTISLIVIPVVLFCAFVSRRIIRAFGNQTGNLIIAILILLTIYDLILLLLTSGRDPGIIPRNTHPPEHEEEWSTMSTDWLSQSSAGAPNVPPVKDVVVNGVVVKVKYCATCMLYRPPRCSHCSVCNNCVERFDHHCPWVGQCIGKTTYENFRYHYDSKRNPYNLGCVRNVFEVFFSKIPEPKSNFREKVDPSSLFPTSSLPLARPMIPEKPKRSFDIETGKRKTVVAEDFEEIHNRIDRVGGLQRCETEPRHTMQSYKFDWDMTPDINVLTSNFARGHSFKDREKVCKKGH